MNYMTKKSIQLFVAVAMLSAIFLLLRPLIAEQTARRLFEIGYILLSFGLIDLCFSKFWAEKFNSDLRKNLLESLLPDATPNSIKTIGVILTILGAGALLAFVCVVLR
jgi:hypothetical protein